MEQMISFAAMLFQNLREQKRQRLEDNARSLTDQTNTPVCTSQGLRTVAVSRDDTVPFAKSHAVLQNDVMMMYYKTVIHLHQMQCYKILSEPGAGSQNSWYKRQ